MPATAVATKLMSFCFRRWRITSPTRPRRLFSESYRLVNNLILQRKRRRINQRKYRRTQRQLCIQSDQRMQRRINPPTNECASGPSDEPTDFSTDEITNQRTDESSDECTDNAADNLSNGMSLHFLPRVLQLSTGMGRGSFSADARTDNSA